VVGSTEDKNIYQKLVHCRFMFRIHYEVMVDDVQKLIAAQLSPRPAQLTLANFNYNVYHPFEEVL